MTSSGKLTSSERGLVKGATEHLVQLELIVQDGLQPNYWEFNDWHTDGGVVDTLLISVPSGTLHEETMDVNTDLGFLCHLFGEHRHD